MTPKEHEKLLNDNVAKTCEKAPKLLKSAINMEAKHIATTHKVEKLVETLAESPAYISLKDHKNNFHQKHPCRLINPCKSNIGVISKSILDRVNSDLRQKLKINQWKNTEDVISWLDSIENKNSCTFTQMDIKEFYPKITHEILDKALSFAKKHTRIDEKEIRTILHCRKSLLFFKNEAWKKSETESCFDVTMGSFDGAEICELVGIYILTHLSKIVPKKNVGLYRDDGLLILRNFTKRQAEINR